MITSDVGIPNWVWNVTDFGDAVDPFCLDLGANLFGNVPSVKNPLNYTCKVQALFCVYI